MGRELNNVVVVDAVRTAFGRAGEKGIFWKTRADDLIVPLLPRSSRHEMGSSKGKQVGGLHCLWTSFSCIRPAPRGLSIRAIQGKSGR